MWWLDDGPAIGAQPGCDPPETGEIDLQNPLGGLQTQAAKTAAQHAEQRREELDTQLHSLQQQLEASFDRADKESELRVTAETELRRVKDEFRQLSDEAELARKEYQDLKLRSAEQRDKLAAAAARLRREVDDCERQLRERGEQMAHQRSESKLRQEDARSIQLETQQLAARHAEQTAALESQVAELRSRVESEQASRTRVEHEIQQVAEELMRQLADERQQCLSSQRQESELQTELARRQHELDQLREAATATTEMQLAAQRRIEAQIDEYQALQRELVATRSSAAESDARKTCELAETRSSLTQHAAELASCREQITGLEQQLREAIQDNESERLSRQRAEASTEPLAHEVDLLRKRVEAFRGLAQREIAMRRKLEAAIKLAGDDASSTLLIRANIEVNERIRRLTTQLTATRNQELSVRQRAIQEINRAQEEVQQLKDQLARERNAA